MPPINSSVTAQLSKPATAAINHLLAQESWARDILRRHAGKEAVIDLSAFALRMRVAGDGLLEASSAETPANVTIHVRLADVPLILQNRERAFSYVKIEGDAEFANTISHLSNTLRWEAEFDLERWIGPIAARRLVGGARDAAEALRTGHRKALENLAEFLTEEQPVLLRPKHLDDYNSGVVRLRDDVERATKRIARLEQMLEQKLAPTGNPSLDH
ncbi:MAG: SCP2 domain-containing protein [Gammaproteobacteria bacterium]